MNGGDRQRRQLTTIRVVDARAVILARFVGLRRELEGGGTGDAAGIGEAAGIGDGGGIGVFSVGIWIQYQKS
jgi:hypothetical protein